MARPTLRTLTAGIAAWDADVDANFNLITGKPFPMAQYATTGDLPAASSYENCLALVGDVLYISNGTIWNIYPMPQAAYMEALVLPTLEELTIAANDLIQKLKDSGLMSSVAP